MRSVGLDPADPTYERRWACPESSGRGRCSEGLSGSSVRFGGKITVLQSVDGRGASVAMQSPVRKAHCRRPGER